VITVSDLTRLPGPTEHEWQWQRLGSCRGMDSATFYHPDGERNPSRARRTARAKEVCARCPVMNLVVSSPSAPGNRSASGAGWPRTERRAIIEGSAVAS